jgi:hypothetical protein
MMPIRADLDIAMEYAPARRASTASPNLIAFSSSAQNLQDAD